ncbi:hypothetical protein I3760_02G196100 [Carya illinoinensis]|nr:hypothetical protein I3760_02G196100 [Carya illinoinensis]
MEGGYVDDKWVQGGTNPEAYAIWHWYLIDVFVYFSHSLVALPPPCWINTAHRHGVKVLGTFIAEWDEGRVICDRLLSTKESAHLYAERLAELADSLGFDGWLINIEVRLDIKQIPILKEFVSHLNETMHSLVPGSLVICWWALVAKSWGILQNYPKKLPFYTNFDQGRGYHFSIDGRKVSDDPCCNISCQGFQPFLEFADNPSPGIIQTLVDLTEASHSGGGNITFEGTLGDNAFFARRLFLGEIPLENLPIFCTYSVRSEGDSQLGLSLHFSSTRNESTTILLTSGDFNQFSGKFSKVIPTHRLERPGNSCGWVLQEGSIAPEKGDILTEIQAVCYRSKYESSEPRPARSSVKYFAELGHLTIRTSEKNLDFLPSSSWLVDGQFIKWVSGSRGSKTLSVKIVWKLKHGTSTAFSKYNIYVKKVTKHVEEVAEYLGTAYVEAFYVSDLVVPSETSSLKFIVQMCAADGTCQNLDDSPTFTVDAEGRA